MANNFLNLSNTLGIPVDENISEKDYTNAVNNLLNKKINNNVKPEIPKGRSPASPDILGINRDVTNDLTRSYLNDSSPELNLPKNNDIVSQDQINSIYEKLAKGMHNNNTNLNFIGSDPGNSATFQPRPTNDLPDKLSQQFVPNRIDYSANPNELYNTPEILLHELTHAKDAKNYRNMAEMEPVSESNTTLENTQNNIHDSLNATSGNHFSPESLDTLYKYPFQQIKEQLLNKITDPANAPHYPPRNFSGINNILTNK